MAVVQNISTVVRLGGSVDASFGQVGKTVRSELGRATKSVKELEREQTSLTKEIKKAKLAGADVSLLTRRYSALGDEIAAARTEQEAFASASEIGDTLGKWASRGAQVTGVVAGSAASLAGLVTMTNAATREQVGLAQSYGMTIEQFKAWGGIAEQAGLNAENTGDLVEELTNKVGEFKALGEQSAAGEVFGALGLDLADLDGLSAVEQFELIMRRLEGVKDAQQAASLADMLFGGEGNKVVTYIRGTGKALDELLDEQRGMNLLTSEGAAGAVTFGQALAKLTGIAGSAWAEISGIVGGQMAGGLDQLSESIGGYLRENKAEIVSTVTTIIGAGKAMAEGLWAGISAIHAIVDGTIGWEAAGTVLVGLIAGKMVVGIAGLVTSMVSVARGLGLARIAMAGFNLVMAANPISLVVLGIGALIAAGIALWRNWDTVKAKIGEVWQSVTGAVSAGVDSIASLLGWSPVDAVAGQWQAFSSYLSGTWQSVSASVSAGMGELWQSVTGAASAGFGHLRELFSWTPLGLVINNWGAISGYIGEVWQSVTGAVSAGISKMADLLSWNPLGMVIANWEPISEFITGLWDRIWQKVAAVFGKVKGALNTVAEWGSKLAFWRDDDETPAAKPASATPAEAAPAAQPAPDTTGYQHAQQARAQQLAATPPASKGTTQVNQRVEKIEVVAAPGQDPKEVGAAVNTALGGHSDAALYDYGGF